MPNLPSKKKALIASYQRKQHKENCEIEKVAMNVLQDEGKTRFRHDSFAQAGFAYGASGRIEKKSAVVGFAVVVAGGAETEGRAEDQQGGRKFPPVITEISGE